MSARRCLLFVPGSRPERFVKAAASGADMVCIDLEDAVALTDKDSARRAALSFLASAERNPSCEWVLRCNALATAEGWRDVLALLDAAALPDLLMLPKVSDATELRLLSEVLGARCPPLIALIEGPRGIAMARDIARAPRVSMLMLGGADYCVELGAEMGAESLLWPRSAMAAAAAEAGIPCMDVPFLDVQDPAGLDAETRRVVALGFAAKAAIHPSQVEVIQRALNPTPERVVWARRVVEAFQASPHAAIQVDGKLVDRPIVVAAERVLRRAGLVV